MVEAAQLQRKTLREWRESFGLQQQELADMCGVAHQRISNIELGERRIDNAVGRLAADALGLSIDQIVPEPPKGIAVPDTSVWEDGFLPSAPCEDLRWWRQRRGLSQRQLAAMAGLYYSHYTKIEMGLLQSVTITTRRKLAGALKVHPNKLILPGDDLKPVREQALEDLLRSELRGSRRALKKVHDFLIDDSNITFKAQDARDALLRDIGPEMKGL